MTQEDWHRQMKEREEARKRMLSEGKKVALQVWKDNDVDHVDFVFSCGGDSMNDTSIEVYDKGGNLVEGLSDIENYFEDAVYNNVNFYEASDGVYMGESGTVTITLTDDEDDFDYCKSSEEEWSETTSFTEKFTLTDEEVDFIDKYVADINGSMAEGDYNVNYKTDFVQTDELIDLEANLVEKIKEYFENYEPDLDNMSDWHTLEVDTTTLDKENKTIDLDMSFQHYVYKSGDN